MKRVYFVSVTLFSGIVSALFLAFAKKFTSEKTDFLFLVDAGNMPTHKEISSSKEGTFGHRFRYHFVDAEDNSNDAWWNWSFQNRYSFIRAIENFGVDSSSEKNSVANPSELKELCKNFYSRSLDNSVLDFSERDAWVYCSVEGFTPITLKDDLDVYLCEDGDDCLPDENSNKNKLSSLDKDSLLISGNDANDIFWELQTKGFFSSEDGKWVGLGQKAKESKAGFKEIFDRGNKDGSSRDALKNKCVENYGKRDDELDSEVVKEILMFCSLQSSSISLKNK
ncbi:hypothetical protein [Candidatus Mycoplasma haematohominis]|uniref:hypothetical protein n=1 Tax=Candidatus Mycoplasma haematohominis TaxID=1494318 RepID=UPI001C0A76A0|nr:hypothetical protein [Candidatus Mycoplasma haemohominis]